MPPFWWSAVCLLHTCTLSSLHWSMIDGNAAPPFHILDQNYNWIFCRNWKLPLCDLCEDPFAFGEIVFGGLAMYLHFASMSERIWKLSGWEKLFCRIVCTLSIVFRSLEPFWVGTFVVECFLNLDSMTWIVIRLFLELWKVFRNTFCVGDKKKEPFWWFLCFWVETHFDLHVWLRRSESTAEESIHVCLAAASTVWHVASCVCEEKGRELTCWATVSFSVSVERFILRLVGKRFLVFARVWVVDFWV